MPTRIFFNDIAPYNSIVVSEDLDTVEKIMRNLKELNAVGVFTDYESREFDKRIIVFLPNITYARVSRVSI